MWNHAQNSLPGGDEDTRESGLNSTALKDKIEKSLDLTQYLKYLEQLFGQATSESESSDSEDGEPRHTRTFTNFLQPPAQSLSERSLAPPPYSHHHHLILGSSNVSDSFHLNPFSALRPSSDNFHLEANISSSSLSSIDSGTSSLSLNLSTETFSETTLAKAEEAASAVPLNENNSFCTESSNSSAPGTEDDKPGEEAGSVKNKKSQKKKKASKGDNESVPRQNKPSSGGKGNHGSKGGGNGGGAGTSGQSSGSNGNGDNSSNSGGSTGCSQNMGSGGSPGAKSRSFQPTGSETMNSSVNMHEADSPLPLHSMLDSPDNLLLNGDGDVSEHFSNGLDDVVDTLESHGMSDFPVTGLLDIQEDENSLSNFISMSAPLSVPSTNMSDSSSPLSQASTNFFSHTAAAAASASFAFSNSSWNGLNGDSSREEHGKKDGGLKRKLEGLVVQKGSSEKFARLTEKQRQNRIKFLDAKRKKIYVNICRKEIGKKQRTIVSTFKESLIMKRKLAQACARHFRKKVVQSEKCMKDSVCKAKRLTQEMELHWKMVDRAERDLLRRKEKEAEEKLKQDRDMLNKKTRQRKLNELVTQLELFGSRLLSPSPSESSENSDILGNLDEDEDEKWMYLDDYDSEQVKAALQTSTEFALKDHQNLVKLLDMSGLYSPGSSSNAVKYFNEISQPQLFEGVLNNCQLYGLSWLTKLYCQGLNGILTGVRELGNSLPTIAFMSHLAEARGLWGPFLIVVPTESLQKWRSNVERMSPSLKVVPYWGKPMERKMLRQFWDKATSSGVHTEEADFHVVITSYQVMVSDLQYISKVKWQYLIVDDSQGAVTSSTKWMPLLSFRCRTKLLLSSCLRLTSLPHLCSYLYFIMPSLFDSQEQLSEWLLKELESPTADNKKCYAKDERIVQRLGSVVRRFMMDCSSQDLQNNMKRNVDIPLYCFPSRRQRESYRNLLERAEIPKILENLDACRPDEVRNRVQIVLNLSAKLKKVCNHPNLLDERDRVSPYWMGSLDITLPKLMYEDGSLLSSSSGVESSNRLFCIYSSDNVQSSVFCSGCQQNENNVTKSSPSSVSTWGFARILGLSCKEVEELGTNSGSARLSNLVNFHTVLEKIYYNRIWGAEQGRNNSLVTFPEHLMFHLLSQSQVLANLVFATTVPHNYHSWDECRISSIPETIEHRRLQSIQNFRLPTRQPSILQFPRLLRFCSENVLSAGIQPPVFSRRKVIQRRILLSEVIHYVRKEGPSYEPVANFMNQAFSNCDWSQFQLPGLDRMIADSCKLQRLERLLTSLKRNGSCRVLICSYVEGTLKVLMDFLAYRRWSYAVLTREGGCKSPSAANGQHPPFVYLLNAHRPMLHIPGVVVDNVVFFDQDWNVKLEEQKLGILSKLEHSAQVSCYRLVCRGTLEENIMRLAKDRNTVSLIFDKDSVIQLNGLCIPSLKGLVSILVTDRGNVCRASHSSSTVEKARPKEKAQIHSELINSESRTKDNDGDETVYGNIEHILDYVNEEREESDLSSPNYSDDPDSNDMDREMDMEECQNDHFSFNQDEGYMGMSPDSFEVEEMRIKSDYEEDSSPKKYRIGRGTGKRGRPPSRARFFKRDSFAAVDVTSSQIRRGPGRPRLKSVGPLNQGLRGRKPGRPPLTKKAETISSGLIPSLSSAPHQRVFGFYSSPPDFELS